MMTVKLNTNCKYDIGSYCEIEVSETATFRYKIINCNDDGDKQVASHNYTITLEEIVEHV